MNKKSCFFACVFFCACSLAFSFSFLVSPQVRYGTAYLSDYLYDKESSERLLSRLDYESSFLLKAGLCAGLTLGNFFADFDAFFTLPIKSGTLYDSDWKSPNIKTDLSIHDLYVNCALDFSVKTGFSFNIFKDTRLCPTLAASYSYKDLSAQKGTAFKGASGRTGLNQDYPWYSPNAVCVRVYGIDFVNHSFLTFTGLSLEHDFLRTTLGISAEVSPFAYFFSVDHHLGREGGTYYQMIQKSFFGAWRTSLFTKYKITERQAILFKSTFTMTKETAGDFYNGYYATWHKIAPDRSSAFRLIHFDATLGYQFRVL